MEDGFNIIARKKGTEMYIFIYDDKSVAETLLLLGRFASNPELSFTWHDAAILSTQIRRQFIG